MRSGSVAVSSVSVAAGASAIAVAVAGLVDVPAPADRPVQMVWLRGAMVCSGSSSSGGSGWTLTARSRAGLGLVSGRPSGWTAMAP